MGFLDKLLPPRDTEGSLIVNEDEEDENEIDDEVEERNPPAARASQTGKNKKPNIEDVLTTYIFTAQETLKAKANKLNTNVEDEDVSFFNSLLPSVRKLNEEEKLRFRMSIMSNLQSIIMSKSGQVQQVTQPPHTPTYSTIPQHSYQVTQPPHTPTYSAIPQHSYQVTQPPHTPAYSAIPQHSYLVNQPPHTSAYSSYPPSYSNYGHQSSQFSSHTPASSSENTTYQSTSPSPHPPAHSQIPSPHSNHSSP